MELSRAIISRFLFSFLSFGALSSNNSLYVKPIKKWNCYSGVVQCPSPICWVYFWTLPYLQQYSLFPRISGNTVQEKNWLHMFVGILVRWPDSVGQRSMYSLPTQRATPGPAASPEFQAPSRSIELESAFWPDTLLICVSISVQETLILCEERRRKHVIESSYEEYQKSSTKFC